MPGLLTDQEKHRLLLQHPREYSDDLTHVISDLFGEHAAPAVVATGAKLVTDEYPGAQAILSLSVAAADNLSVDQLAELLHAPSDRPVQQRLFGFQADVPDLIDVREALGNVLWRFHPSLRVYKLQNIVGVWLESVDRALQKNTDGPDTVDLTPDISEVRNLGGVLQILQRAATSNGDLPASLHKEFSSLLRPEKRSLSIFPSDIRLDGTVFNFGGKVYAIHVITDERELYDNAGYMRNSTYDSYRLMIPEREALAVVIRSDDGQETYNAIFSRTHPLHTPSKEMIYQYCPEVALVPGATERVIEDVRSKFSDELGKWFCSEISSRFNNSDVPPDIEKTVNWIAAERIGATPWTREQTRDCLRAISERIMKEFEDAGLHWKAN